MVQSGHELLGLLLKVSNKGVPLLLSALEPALTGSLGLSTLGVHLLLESTLTGSLSLGLVDVLNQSTLVLEGVTLAQLVQAVVKVLVDLAGLTVLDEEPAEDTEAAHPKDLGGHTSIGGTLTLTETGVTTSTLGELKSTSAGTGVHRDGLLDNQTVGNELADSLTRVGVGDLVHLIGVHPDLPLTAVHDGRSEALLSAKIDHFEISCFGVVKRPFVLSMWVVLRGGRR